VQLELSDERACAGRQQLHSSKVPPGGDVHVTHDVAIRPFPSHTGEARETTTSQPSR
jgi:hypothetical protein